MSFRPYNTLKSSGVELKYQNATGALLNKATPVRSTPSGQIDYIDVSVESQVLALIGVTSSNIVTDGTGPVVTVGRIENITTSAVFGDAIYLSKTGDLTNLKPDVGVGGFLPGDFVVRIGTVAKNENNPLQKDLVLELALVGQLA